MMKDVDMSQTLSKEDKAFNKRPKVGHKGKGKKTMKSAGIGI